MRVTVDTRQFRRLHKELEKFAKKALPYAARNAVNGCAFEAQKRWRREVKSTFTNRNPFTERSIRVERAKGLDMRTMHAVTGSVAPYMGDRERGGVIRGKSKHKPIPGPAAAGLPAGTKRSKVVRPRFHLGKIQLGNDLAGLRRYGRRQQNAAALAMAARRGDKFALLNRGTGKGRGIFSIKPLSRRTKTSLLYDLSRSSVRAKPEPTMQRAVAASSRAFEAITRKALVDQLRRHRVFGY